MTWWKFIYDTKTPTWSAYGRVAFVQAATEDAARALGMEAARAEYPASEILPFDIGQSTAEAAAAFAVRRARWQQWMENNKAGIPNSRSGSQKGSE